MALGKFFGKNALAAHQILNGMTPDTFAAMLGGHVVGIALDDAAALSQEGRTTAELATNLAARLYPRLSIVTLGRTGGPGARAAAELQSLALAINPDIELAADPAAVTAVIVVGDTRSAGAPATVYAGSRGWDALISPDTPRRSGDTPNPFGAAAAACLAAANVFRSVFGPYLTEADLDPELTLSLYDFQLRPTSDTAPDPGEVPVDLDDTVLAGVGAVGTAVVWTLARVPRLEGTLHLVDPEGVALSNLQRYVITTQAHAERGVPKVDLATRVLGDGQRARGEAGLQVVPHAQRWGEFLRARADWRLPRVLTAFDTKEDRIAAQAALPRRLLNAWTQLGDLGVSRHLNFGSAPCLACLYRPRTGGKSDAELVGDAMGLPGAPMEIRMMLQSHAAIGADFVRGVAKRRGIADEGRLQVLLAYSGHSLRAFYNEAFCGGVVLRLGGTAEAPDVQAEAPMAFQSALAGVMLAAELFIDAQPQLRPAGRPVRTVIDLLRPVPPFLNQPAGRRTDGLCLCNDPDYLDAYTCKYTDAQHP
jgi:hypothetical protein